MSSTNTECIRLIFIGRPVIGKGLADLLSALTYLLHYNWSLTVVGDVISTDIFKELVNTFAADRIHFLGPVKNPDICPLLNHHQIVVVPSHYENFGQVALEAMACGKAIIASRTGGLREIIIDGYNGIHCNPRDPIDLSVKLKLLFDSPELINRLGCNALKDVSKYSWQRIIIETLKILKKYSDEG